MCLFGCYRSYCDAWLCSESLSAGHEVRGVTSLVNLLLFVCIEWLPFVARHEERSLLEL